MAKTRSRSRTVLPWLLLVLAVAAVLAWLEWGEGLRRTGEAGSAYAARVACSCRFVAGRSLDDCAKDKLQGMELISLSEDVDAKSVTASIPFVVSDTARFHDGYGCVLKEWRS